VRRGSVALLCVLGASLLSSAPSLAASQRGHYLRFSFGTQGTEEGQFSHPAGLAVNDSTGDVYVADRENNRVEEFKPKLNEHGELIEEEFVTAFAVKGGADQVAVDNCTKGSEACTKAEDPSVGDVYVTNGTETVYKFSPEGVLIQKLKKFKEEEGGRDEKFEPIAGVAVNPAGALFVYQEDGIIATFNDAEENIPETSVHVGTSQSAEPGLAVDAEGNFYLGLEVCKAEACAATKELGSLLDEAGNEYFTYHGRPLALVAKLGPAGNVGVGELDYEDTTAVAVNPADVPGNSVDERNDVYVDNVTSVAGEPVTTVAEFSTEGETPKLIQRFGAQGLREGEGVAVDSANGVVFVSDASSDKVDVFELEAPGRPTVDSLSSQSLAPSATASNATQLTAQVNPAGSDTHYYFEYGLTSCASTPTSCAKTAPTDVGGGFGDQNASTEVQNLPPGLYYYRVVAENGFATIHSVEKTFTILASVNGLPDGRAWEMVSPPEKDGNEPEALTNEGGLIQASESGDAITYVANGPMPAKDEPEGSRSPEPTQVLSTRGSEGGSWSSQNIITPYEKGSGVAVGKALEYRYFSPNLALSLLEPFTEGQKSGSLAKPPLSPETQEKTIYLRDDAPIAPETNSYETEEEQAEDRANYEAARKNGEAMKNPGYLALVSGLNSAELGGGEFGGGEQEGVEVWGVTRNLGHVVFKSYKADPGLYEWGGAGKPLELVSELPPPGKEHVSPFEANLAGPGRGSARHAISNDGSLVFWKTPGHLFARDTKTHETLQLDAVQAGASGAGHEEALFDAASADGSKVFFTDEQRLTPDSNAAADSHDLYVFELTLAGGQLSGTLTDLTPEAGANVLVNGAAGGGVLGASEDGSYVYFVANGALAGTGASQGYCGSTGPVRPPGTTCNLYMRHYNGTEWTPPKLVAALSFEDLPDWGGEGADLGAMTARVSPNGRFLAFMSDRGLTGYDNEDQTSAKAGEILDEEVYLYDASSERLSCASCDPNGARPAGVHDLGFENHGASGEGSGLVVDRPEIWSPGRGDADHWLAGNIPGWTKIALGDSVYQSRYLSNEGRLFFNSPDHLVPAASGDKEKVYEYEPNGLGGCHSEAGCVGLLSLGTSEHEAAFLDASVSGSDVFFLTEDQLLPQDVDGNFDVYDAHVCEAASTCPPPPSGATPPCDEVKVACKGPQTSEPAFAPPASTSVTGSGNVLGFQAGKTPPPPPKPKIETRAQKLAKALKACKKDKKKSKRLECEKVAKKKYGAKKAAKKSAAKGKRP
jgi:hypothetical protein